MAEQPRFSSETSLQPDQPGSEALDLRDPTLTDDQNTRYDLLVDNGGFNRAQALSEVGAMPENQEVEDARPATSAQVNRSPANHPVGPRRVGSFVVKGDGTPDRRFMSPRERLAADQPPAHIRHR